jgi:DNA-binding transcriptional regulator PaaX
MEQEVLRHLIRSKLADGRLPQDSIPRLWGGAGNGETCDACEETIAKTQFVMEGVSTTTGGLGIQFHEGCLHGRGALRPRPG